MCNIATILSLYEVMTMFTKGLHFVVNGEYQICNALSRVSWNGGTLVWFGSLLSLHYQELVGMVGLWFGLGHCSHIYFWG